MNFFQELLQIETNFKLATFLTTADLEEVAHLQKGKNSAEPDLEEVAHDNVISFHPINKIKKSFFKIPAEL